MCKNVLPNNHEIYPVVIISKPPGLTLYPSYWNFLKPRSRWFLKIENNWTWAILSISFFWKPDPTIIKKNKYPPHTGLEPLPILTHDVGFGFQKKQILTIAQVQPFILPRDLLIGVINSRKTPVIGLCLKFLCLLFSIYFLPLFCVLCAMNFTKFTSNGWTPRV